MGIALLLLHADELQLLIFLEQQKIYRRKHAFRTDCFQRDPFQCDTNKGESSVPDMAVQNCIGDSFRGATWVALHNGGGVGW
jgi:hypothetical protein